jgi:hypothetical protein
MRSFKSSVQWGGDRRKKKKTTQELKGLIIYSLSRRAGVSLGVPKLSIKRLKDATAVLIWKTPAANACEGSCCRRTGGKPPDSMSRKLISYPRLSFALPPFFLLVSSYVLRLAFNPTVSVLLLQILSQKEGHIYLPSLPNMLL